MKTLWAAFAAIVAQWMLILAPVAGLSQPVCQAACPRCLATCQAPQPASAAKSCCADHANVVPQHSTVGETIFQGCCCSPAPLLPAPVTTTVVVAPAEDWVALPAQLNGGGQHPIVPNTPDRAVAPFEADRVIPASRPIYLRYHVFLT